MADEKKEKVKLTIARVKEDLKNGIDRTDMIKLYGLSRADIGRLFKRPELKGLKVQREVEEGFILTDEAGAEVSAPETSAASATDEGEATASNSSDDLAADPATEESNW